MTDMRMNERGFTMIELFVVFVLVGAMVAIAAPRISDRLTKISVRSARDAVATLHAKARAAAIQRGRSTTLKVSGTSVLITTLHPVSGVLDTIDQPTNVYSRYDGVTMTWSRDSVSFDARGIGQQSTNTTITFSRAGYADTLVVSSVGTRIQ
jgi:Tfp pilus assembly protein FimT